MLEVRRRTVTCQNLPRRTIACWKLDEERSSVRTYKIIDSILKLKEETWSVRTYKKIDSLLEVRRSKIEC